MRSLFAKKTKKPEEQEAPKQELKEPEAPNQNTKEQPAQEPETKQPEAQLQNVNEQEAKKLNLEEQVTKEPETPKQEAKEQEPQKQDAKEPEAQQQVQQKPKAKGLTSWFAAKQKKKQEKEAKQKKLEWPHMKLLTLLVTLITMAVGMSFLPLLPQPLPIVLAVLVALLTYKSPMLGMPVGGAILGLGLMAHLAQLGFIAYLGVPVARMVFVVLVIGLLVVLPVFFHSYSIALAIDFGVLAVISLLFDQTYFLAVPLILTSAVFLKKSAGFTILYYSLLSSPLLVYQYFTYIKTIPGDQWWLASGANPPLLSPLSAIFKEINWGLNQFRLFDASRVIYNIQDQINATPDLTGRNIGDAIIQYLSSIPGILLFLILVAGLGLALVFVTRNLIKKSRLPYADRLFSSISATFAALMFFLFLILLQAPLGFAANVNVTMMLMAVGATLLFTLPAAFVDLNPKKRVTPQEMLDKEKALEARLKEFQAVLGNIRNNIPVDISSPEAKTGVVKDSLEDIVRKQQNQFYEIFNLEEFLEEPDKLNKELDGVETELYSLLSQYQIQNGCQLSNWKGKLRESGISAEHLESVEFKKDLPLEQRIDAIKQILNSGRTLAKDMINEVESTHTLVRNCYAPNMPQKNRAVEFTEQKMVGMDVPWIAVDGLFSSLNNFNRQFGLTLLRSMMNLRSSLPPIANLKAKQEILPLVFGEHLPRVIDYINTAKAIQASLDKHTFGDYLSLMDIIVLKNNLQSMLVISSDMLSTLYARIQAEEETIQSLVPTDNYLWAKNDTLSQRLKKATENLANTAEYKDNQVLENLPEYISYIDEAVETIYEYAQQKEFLLNYPTAEAAIEEQLKRKKQLTPQDLPFQEKFAGEYLKIYYSQRFNKFAFDKQNMILTKRAQA